MRRAAILLCTFVTVCGLGWLSAGGVVSAAHQHAGAHQDFPPRPGASPIVIGLPNLNPPTSAPAPPHSNPPPARPAPTPRPTPKPPPAAVRVALSNGYVRALVGGKPYRVKSVDPWSTGSIVRVAFYHPATITGTWLTVGRAPYRATYRNVKSIKIFVDMRRSQVVATVPYPRRRT